MKKAKMILSLMLSAVMVGGLLTGCGSSAAPAEENVAEAPQTEEAEAAPAGERGGKCNRRHGRGLKGRRFQYHLRDHGIFCDADV